jgi:beta-glucosidase
MQTAARAIAAALVVLATLSGRAGAASGPCRDAVADAGQRLLDRSVAALSACRRSVARGSLPAGTDCLGDAATGRKRAAATVKPAERVQAACSDGDVAAIAPGGACFGATTLAKLVACQRASHGVEAESLTAVTDAAAGPLSYLARKCVARASSETRRFAVARLRLLQQCKTQLPLPLGTDCTTEPATATQIAGLRGRAAAKIARRCGAALGQTPFGTPCDTAANADDLALCLLAAADRATDGALASEYHDGGFCGDATAAIEPQVEALLAQMSLADKIAQMHGASLSAGIWHTADNLALGIPGLAMTDGPRGVGAATGHATAFPVGMARGATWDPALEERVGEAFGAEVRAKGGSMLLAPTINMLRHPRWGRAQETYGEDTVHMGRMATGFIRGAQQHVIANAKHYAGNSIENSRFNVDVTIDERTLREVYLPHFHAAVRDAHVGAVMSAYNKTNGQYCGENLHLIHDVLKGDWDFQGFVESDWFLGTRSTVPSITAGLDIEMPSGTYYGQPLADAVTGDVVAETLVDDAVRRILRAKLCFRLDTDPPVVDPGAIETPAHLAVALDAAREGIVLLKNVGGALPLDRSQVGSVVVVGTIAAAANIGDHGSSNVSPTSVVTALDGITNRAGGGVTVTYVPGPSLSPADQATIAAAGAVVVVAGLTFNDEGEGQVTPGDRVSLAMPGTQDALVAAVAALNPRTVVVLEGSGPILMPWLNDVSAILTAWYPGEQGGLAIGDVLFGDVTPSGKLPVSFPVAEADLPPFDNVSLAVTYDYYHGYRYLDRNGTTPLFPFGFGLSYTTFQVANLSVSPQALSPAGRLHVTADVGNTGAVAGDEVVQLYVSAQGSAVDRPVRELKAFARVHLAPGETRTVLFEVPASDLAFWDVGAGAFVVEPIGYTVHVGTSSRDLPLSGSFAVVVGALP